MSGPKPEPEGADASDAEEASEAEQAIAALRMVNDVEGLMKLAKQFRAGQGVPRDMHACFMAYVAAAEMGSATAQHAVGLFYFNGGVVARDEKAAAAQFRAAADQGHVGSKMLVANFYELGIHYRADASKADVWYRNAARAASIEEEPGSPEYARALADIGAVRYCLELASLPGTPDEEKARLLKIAKTYGHRPEGYEGRASSLSIEGLPPESRIDPTGTPRPSTSTKKTESATETETESETETATETKTKTKTKTETEKKPAKTTAILPKANVGLGATAFLFTLVFMAVGLVGGHVLDRFAFEQVNAGKPVPIVGMHAELVLPILVGVLGLLPNMLVYRRAAFFRAVMISIASGIAGNILYGTGRHFLETNIMQTTDFAAGGMLLGLLIFGIFGGAKPGSH